MQLLAISRWFSRPAVKRMAEQTRSEVKWLRKRNSNLQPFGSQRETDGRQRRELSRAQHIG